MVLMRGEQVHQYQWQIIFQLAEGTEMVMPGDNIEMSIELITPIAIEKGLRNRS